MVRRYTAIAVLLKSLLRLTSGFGAPVMRGSRSMCVIDAAGTSTISGLVRRAGTRSRRVGGERLSLRITILVVPAANASTKDTPSSLISGCLAAPAVSQKEAVSAMKDPALSVLSSRIVWLYSAAIYVILCYTHSVKTILDPPIILLIFL